MLNPMGLLFTEFIIDFPFLRFYFRAFYCGSFGYIIISFAVSDSCVSVQGSDTLLLCWWPCFLDLTGIRTRTGGATTSI